MINKQNKDKIITQYLQGKLSSELAREVEERIQTDAEFLHEVTLQERIMRTIYESERVFLNNELDHLFEDNIGWSQEEHALSLVPLAKKRSGYTAGMVAALLLIATGIAFWWYGKPTTSKVQYMKVALPANGHDSLSSKVAGSLPVLIIDDKMLYDFHYQLGDTLRLYGYFQPSDMQLHYNAGQQGYVLRTDGHTYPLAKTDMITPLQPRTPGR